MLRTALLIPIYEPEEISIDFLRLFKKEDFDRFLVVNDGSGPSFEPIFKRIEEETVFEVVSYEGNKGKGFALRHGISILKEENPSLIVTADGDGQHAYKDILRIRDAGLAHPSALIMGNRLFGKDIPLASKIGHVLANYTFQFATKKRVDDTQTGLRGIPSCLFELALKTPGNRYDYEHDFLIEAAKCGHIVNIGVEAIYINKNANSHFRPVLDTLIIHKKVLLMILVSLIAALIDLGCFYYFSNSVFTASRTETVFLSVLNARAISGLFRFLAYFFFFTNREHGVRRYLGRYAVRFTSLLILSACFTYVFSYLPVPLLVAKLLADILTLIGEHAFARLYTYFALQSDMPIA